MNSPFASVIILADSPYPYSGTVSTCIPGNAKAYTLVALLYISAYSWYGIPLQMWNLSLQTVPFVCGAMELPHPPTPPDECRYTFFADGGIFVMTQDLI